MRTGETKKNHKCQTSLKKASLNSCSVTAIQFCPSRITECSSEAVGGMQEHHHRDIEAGLASDAPFALVWWHRHCEAEQKQDSQLLALTPPPPIAASDTRTSPAHPHQEICRCFSKPGYVLLLLITP